MERYVTTHKGGPIWDTVVRRVTVNTDTGNIIQDILVKDQPTGYDWHASLPDGVRNIQTRLYWQPAEPTMLGNEQRQHKLGNEREARPKEKVRVVIDDRLSPLPTSGRKPPIEISENFPTEARIKQKEKQKADKEAGIKPRKIKKHIEFGNDDCGDDLKGLGLDTSALHVSTDVPLEELDDDEDEEHMYIMLPSRTPAVADADIFTIIPTLLRY